MGLKANFNPISVFVRAKIHEHFILLFWDFIRPLFWIFHEYKNMSCRDNNENFKGLGNFVTGTLNVFAAEISSKSFDADVLWYEAEH